MNEFESGLTHGSLIFNIYTTLTEINFLDSYETYQFSFPVSSGAGSGIGTGDDFQLDLKQSYDWKKCFSKGCLMPGPHIMQSGFQTSYPNAIPNAPDFFPQEDLSVPV